MNEHDKFHRRYNRLLQLIEAQPGIAKTDLTLTTRSLAENERNELLAELIADGAIEEQVTRSGRRPRYNYWPADHPQSPTMQQAGRESVLDVDTAKMSRDEILAFNERRRAFNRHLLSIGCDAIELLPLKT
jgi:hypothetical protein